MAERNLISEFEARRVVRMLHELMGWRLKGGEDFRIDGGVEAGWVSVRWELAAPDRSRVYPVEARVQVSARLRDRQAVELLYDLLAGLFEEHLKDRDPFSGPEWEEVEFAGHKVYLRGQMLNETAERIGSTLLDADAADRSRALKEQQTSGHEDPEVG